MRTKNLLTTGTRLLVEYENETRIALAYADQIIDDITHGRSATAGFDGLSYTVRKIKDSGLHAMTLRNMDLVPGGRA